MRIKIGDLLVKAGVITDAQLKSALAEQAQWGGKLGDILVRMEFLTEEILVRALSKQTAIPRADLAGESDPGALEKVPAEVAEELNLVPLALQDDDRTLLVAMTDPLNLMVTDHLRSITGCKIVAQLAGTSAIRSAISRWYRGQDLAAGSTGDLSSLRIMNNSGNAVVTLGARAQAQAAADAARVARAAAAAVPARAQAPPRRGSAVKVLRGVEETQRKSVAALKAMVELLIEKGVFSRDEYLSRVKR
ncbi:MAG TPA: hypothetical protein VN874_02395 [Myxococcales bacterium]|jgi:hypothetical protein|nr:hypothetical protein [Myxococcales bacterium]